ncbi:uncharacterized protein BXIN_2813 [Babesia sp. Xinjiang]|uniref:uncharacterized protein n=1 Tax=Babesia sp. Xinjiang TaxID=462227 RepID=UPI000A222A68|nr:uncharacterized protein BXIN_2813 [Babesia sp. Xinjiang]ORM41678.1 hypothetical protein BXIN_2813 [Babesia sp. Xinjiang]
MAESAILPMLYEFLVSESRYEVRGGEYRARLRSLFDNMLLAQLAFPSFTIGNCRQLPVKALDELVNSVGVLDHEDVKTFRLRACPGIRQYAYPGIPEFTRLNMHYVKSWHEFFGFIDKRERAVATKPRRSRHEELTSESHSSTESEEETSSSDSDASVEGDRIDAVITADDILSPRTPPDSIRSLLGPDPSTSGVDPGEVKDKSLLRWHRRIPIYMDSAYKIDHGTAVFGIMNDRLLEEEWACSSSYSSYESLFQQFMVSEDQPDNCEDAYVKGSLDGEIAADDGSEVATAAYSEKGTYVDDTDNVNESMDGYISEGMRGDSAVSWDQVDDEGVKGPIIHADCVIDEELDTDLEDKLAYTGDSDERSVDSESDDDNGDDGVVAGEDRPQMYDPDCVYGNYYVDVPRDCPRTLKASLDESDVLGDRASMKYHNFTTDAVDITSTVVVGADGVPQVSCMGTLGTRQRGSYDPRLLKYHNGQVTLQNRLEFAISGLFAIKNAVSAECTTCSGWSLNNGVSVIFCEICEDRLLEDFDSAVVNRLFELRSHLISDLYPSIGYSFANPNAKECAKGEGYGTYVTIPALCDIGGVYPKASMHDGRYIPNATDVPFKALCELNSIVLTNAELWPYSEGGSQILSICEDRQQRSLRGFNEYLNGLCKLYESATSNVSYVEVLKEFNNVFKQGRLPFMCDGVDTKRQFFDELTSSLLCKLPLDPELLRTMFYRQGIYAGRPEHGRRSNLLALAQHNGRTPRNPSSALNYPWHTMALKYWGRKTGSGDHSSKFALKSSGYRMRPGLYQDFVDRTAVFDRLPRGMSARVKNSGRLELGFPTSLQMHVAGVPDAVIDPSLYTKCGMAFFYSISSIIQNLCALSMFMWPYDDSENNYKRRARDDGAGRPVF